MKRRWWKKALLALVVGLVALVALAFVDHCGPWPARAPWVRSTGRASGPLLAGGAVVPLSIRFPTTVAGYAPPRPTATSAAAPLTARATVVQVGDALVSLVTLDTCFVTARMQRAVQEGQPGRVWLIATHTHTSVGGYDARPVAELAALGWYDAVEEAALVEAARTAVARARAALEPVRLEVGSAEVTGLTVSRTGDEVERTLTVVRFVGAAPVAQWLVFSAHPTLAAPRLEKLDPDWPSRLAELAGPQVTLVLQGAGGNATVDRDAAPTPEAFAARLFEHVKSTPTQPAAPLLAWAEVGFALPHPDGSRLVPRPYTAPVENALCIGQEPEAMVTLLRLGSASLLFTSLEPSAAAGRALEEQAGVDRVVGLANGYHGYLEPEAVARADLGEARLQYFPPGFAQLVGQAAALARGAVASPAP